MIKKEYRRTKYLDGNGIVAQSEYRKLCTQSNHNEMNFGLDFLNKHLTVTSKKHFIAECTLFQITCLALITDRIGILCLRRAFK